MTAGSGEIVAVRGARTNATVLSVCRAQSPLRLLTPKNHGDASWAYLATFGGGLVAGDRVALSVDVACGAALFLGTQSQTKVFRGASSSSIHARVADGALLVVWPDPVSCFAGANYMQDTLIEVEPGGSAIVVDAFTSGRPAHERPWSFERYASRTRIVSGSADAGDRRSLGGAGARRPVLVEGVLLEHASLSRVDAMGAFATLLAFGPRAASLGSLAEVGTVRAAHDGDRDSSASAAGASVACSSAAFDDGRVIARAAATRADDVAVALGAYAAKVVELLGDDPFRTSPVRDTAARNVAETNRGDHEALRT